MIPAFNYKNSGRDATVDPAYLAKLRAQTDSMEIEELQREVAQLKIQVQALEEEKVVIIEKINELENDQEELQNQIINLNNIIESLQQQISSLETTIAEMDGHAPIELEFIDNLPPYNLQEGVG